MHRVERQEQRVEALVQPAHRACFALDDHAPGAAFDGVDAVGLEPTVPTRPSPAADVDSIRDVVDDLLSELRERAGAVQAAHERLSGLQDAVVAVASDLHLALVLERIVSAARLLSGARYGAVGVIGTDSRPVDVVTHGIDDATRERIGDLPTGHDVLGVLIEDPRPVRLNRARPAVLEDGGTFELGPAPGRGTRLRWEVPLAPAAAP